MPKAVDMRDNADAKGSASQGIAPISIKKIAHFQIFIN